MFSCNAISKNSCLPQIYLHIYTKTFVQGYSLKHLFIMQETGNNLNISNLELKKLWHIKRVEYCTTIKKNEVELYVFMQKIPSYIKGRGSKKRGLCILDYHMDKKWKRTYTSTQMLEYSYILIFILWQASTFFKKTSTTFQKHKNIFKI